MTNSDDNFVIFVYCLIRSTQYGKWRNLTYRDAKRRYRRHLRQTGWISRCPEAGCGVFITGSNWTVDHIIPLWVCRAYGMPQLEFDFRNFRVMCEKCNGKRGNREITLNDLTLPEKVKARLLAMPTPIESDFTPIRIRA